MKKMNRKIIVINIPIGLINFISYGYIGASLLAPGTQTIPNVTQGGDPQIFSVKICPCPSYTSLILLSI